MKTKLSRFQKTARNDDLRRFEKKLDIIRAKIARHGVCQMRAMFPCAKTDTRTVIKYNEELVELQAAIEELKK